MQVDCDLIIFDKGGTITDFQSTWVPIIRKRVQLLAGQYGERIQDQLFKAIGLDDSSWQADLSGPFMVLADAQLVFVFALVLYENGVPWVRALQAVNECYRLSDEVISRVKLVKLIPGTDVLLRKLRGSGFSLAIATMDTRSETYSELQKLGILSLFDTIVAVDDVRKHKPDPEMILKICGILNISPERAVMVGDTPADLIMGKRAGVAAAIALTANSTAEVNSLADAVISSYSDVSILDSGSNPKAV